MSVLSNPLDRTLRTFFIWTAPNHTFFYGCVRFSWTAPNQLSANLKFESADPAL